MRYLQIKDDLKSVEIADIGTLSEYLGTDIDEVAIGPNLVLMVRDDCLMYKNRPIGMVEVYESGGRTDLIRGPACVIATTENGDPADLATVGDPAEIAKRALDVIRLVKVMDINGDYYVIADDKVPMKHRSLHYCDLGEEDFVPLS